MKLDKKKYLAAKVLGIGKERVVFEKSRLDEIKEAITRQDIRDLVAGGAIRIMSVKGRKRRKRNKEGHRKIRKKLKKRKQNYVKLTRRLRKILSALKEQGKISNENYSKLRKRIKAKSFKDSGHFQEHIKQME